MITIRNQFLCSIQKQILTKKSSLNTMRQEKIDMLTSPNYTFQKSSRHHKTSHRYLLSTALQFTFFLALTPHKEHPLQSFSAVPAPMDPSNSRSPSKFLRSQGRRSISLPPKRPFPSWNRDAVGFWKQKMNRTH